MRSKREPFAALCIATPFLFAGSLLQQPKMAHSEEQSSPIIVLAQDSYLSYHKTVNNSEAGWYYDLIQNWAQENSLQIEFKLFKTQQDVLTALRAGQGDIALAPFYTEDSNYNDLLAGPAIDEVNYNLVCKRKRIEKESLRILFPPSAYLYKQVEEELGKIDHYLSFNSVDDAVEILDKVSYKNYDCGVFNSVQSHHNLRFHERLELVQSFTQSVPMGWLIAPHATDLNQSLWDWVSETKNTEKWTNIWRRYFDYQHAMDRFETIVLNKRMRTRFPHYKKAFKAAAKHYSLPWQLVAAVSYQESHWDAKAKSYTGVRGIMQLTRNTADFLGVENRLDPYQSIWGGAKYLRLLLDRTPISAHPKDRLAMALAGYNVGWGHIEDVRQMALNNGKDPNSWNELKELLPLLAHEEYYSKTKYGYARGWEPVTYVERIQNYYDIIQESQIN